MDQAACYCAVTTSEIGLWEMTLMGSKKLPYKIEAYVFQATEMNVVTAS